MREASIPFVAEHKPVLEQLEGLPDSAWTDIGLEEEAIFASHRPGGWDREQLCEIHDSHRSPVAAEGLRRIAAMYAIEKKIRGEAPEVRLAERQKRTAPLVEDIGEWLRQQRGRVSARSRLGEKLAYIGNHWDGLRVFLADGRVEMDNNIVENTIRPLALNRKNALFAGHEEGARAWARIASLIETAKMNQVDPHAWLKATLEAIAAGHPASDIDSLLPWAFPPASTR